MEILELIKKRRSIRRFKLEPIPEKDLTALKEALVWAPSAGNLQSRKFFFVFNRQLKQAMAEAAMGQRYVAEAPLCVVGCVDYQAIRPYGERGTKFLCQHDLAAAIQNLLLTAASLGLGSVWVGVFEHEKVSEILALPRHLYPVALVPVGYPDEYPRIPPRLNIEEGVEEIR